MRLNKDCTFSLRKAGDRINNDFNLPSAHFRKERQGQNSGLLAVCIRKLARRLFESRVRRQERQRYRIVDIRLYVSSREVFRQLIATRMLYYVEMPDMFATGGNHRK